MSKKITPTPKHEVRSYTAVRPLTVRTTADGSKQVSGYAIVFNSQSADLGGFKEICSPNMLTRTLRENPDVLALRDHKQELLIGRTTAKTLDLSIDGTGLAFTITLPRTAIGDDTAENVRLRNLTGVSFGFVTVEDSWAADSQGDVIRTLLDIDLFEISITSFPAYEATSVNTRSCPITFRSKITTRDDIDEIIYNQPSGDQTTGDGDTTGGWDDDSDEDRCKYRCAAHRSIDATASGLVEDDPFVIEARCAFRCGRCLNCRATHTNLSEDDSTARSGHRDRVKAEHMALLLRMQS